MHQPQPDSAGFGAYPGVGAGGYPPPPGGFPLGGYAQGGYPGGYPQGYSGGYPPGGYQPGVHPGFVQPQPPGYGSHDPEDGQFKGFEFNDVSIRRAFIRKVYSILMLLVTFGAVTLFTFHEPTKFWVKKNPALMWVALGVAFFTLITMSCFEKVRRKSPMNVIFLGIFTLAESFLLGVIAARYEAKEVMLAVGITAAVCLGLTLFALQTKWDFTVMGGVLLVCLIIFFLFGLIAMFFHGKILTLVYSSVGALLFSFYLIYDTQMMLGGKHKYSISPEDYIFAALSLYIDIINIFLYILSIIGASND